MGWLGRVAALCRFEIERAMRVGAAAFGGPPFLPLVPHHVLQTCQQPRAKPALRRLRALENAPRDNSAREELLGEILGGVRRMPAATQVGIKGIPVGMAQFLHRGGSLRRSRPGRGQHHTPMRGGKAPPSRCRLIVGMCGGHALIQAAPSPEGNRGFPVTYLAAEKVAPSAPVPRKRPQRRAFQMTQANSPARHLIHCAPSLESRTSTLAGHGGLCLKEHNASEWRMVAEVL